MTKRLRYVGKGKGRRAWDFKSRKNFHKRWLKKLFRKGLRPTVKILARNLDEKTAFELEIAIIKASRELREPICNLTNGGEGTSGYKWSRKLRSKLRRIMQSSEYREKLSKVHKGKRRSLVTRQKLSNLAKNRTKEHKRKLAEARRGKFSKERCLSMSEKRFNKRVDSVIESSSKAALGGRAPTPFICEQTGEIFEYLFEARNKYGVPTSNLKHVLEGKRKAVGGLSFRYL